MAEGKVGILVLKVQFKDLFQQSSAFLANLAILVFYSPFTHFEELICIGRVDALHFGIELFFTFGLGLRGRRSSSKENKHGDQGAEKGSIQHFKVSDG
jgi:hypothetical protein